MMVSVDSSFFVLIIICLSFAHLIENALNCRDAFVQLMKCAVVFNQSFLQPEKLEERNFQCAIRTTSSLSTTSSPLSSSSSTLRLNAPCLRACLLCLSSSKIIRHSIQNVFRNKWHCVVEAFLRLFHIDCRNYASTHSCGGAKHGRLRGFERALRL